MKPTRDGRTEATSGRRRANPESTVSPWSRLLRLQPLFWLSLGILYFIFDQGVQDTEPQYLFLLLRAVFWAGVGGLVTTGLVLLYGLINLDTRSLAFTVPVCLLGCIIASLASILLYDLIDRTFEIEPGYESLFGSRIRFFFEYFHYFFVIAIWHGSVMAYVHFVRAAALRERAIRMRQLATEARMNLLRGQLGPHFLFNSLNAAIAQIKRDPPGAESTLTRLSELLRETLNRSDEKRIELKDELQLVNHYMAIEKTRFEDKLKYDTTGVNPEAGNYSMPPFLVQPLVENAVKHGMRTSPMPLEITVFAAIEGSSLVVEVANTSTLQPHTTDGQGEGVGLRNLRERLDVELGHHHEFHLTSENGLVRATLRIDTLASD